MSSSNVIDFLKAKEQKGKPDPDYIVIDTKINGPELGRRLDELWNEIYSGKVLREIFADDDGRIHYRSEWPKDDELNVLRGHLLIFTEFINERNLTADFMDHYDQAIEEKGIRRILTSKPTE